MADAAKVKRREQLKRWAGSSTDREPPVPRQRRKAGTSESGDAQALGPTVGEDGSPAEDSGKAATGQREGHGEAERAVRRRKVRFERAAEFLAACACGDTEEAQEMLREEREGEGEGSGLVNSANADGITALHQACIDESMEMVDFLLAHGANVNQADNEGWTALHVAASCGHLEIADFLLQNGASLAAVNCDGDVPVDIAEDEATETLLTETTRRQGLDVESVKRREEEEMMRDAQCWLKDGMPTDLRHPKNGATPLHVAAAKGYLEVMRALCDCGVDLSVGDSDGWTPLHAAAHWGQMDACRLLAERHCDMEAQSHSGQTPFDVADESVESLLEELAQKQAQWRTQHQSVSERQQSVSESSAESPASTTSKNRRSSVCRMSSREKMSVQDQSKERGAPGGLELREEERESSPESSVVSSPDSESVSTLSPTDPLTVAKAQEQREREEREREERERERESRTARVQPTPQRRDTPPESPADRQTDRRKYQAPVRDEESESQRRARSRLMRQSRRSTQGVTLTDLKEAEKTVNKTTQESQRSVQTVSPVVTITPAERDVDPAADVSLQDGERERGIRLGVKERRRGRKERRSTGLIHGMLGENEDSDGVDDSLSDSSNPASESAAPGDQNSRASSPDYKMLYRAVLTENERLREQLQEAELLLNQNKVELERQRQSHERSTERPALLELERFEKRALERRAIELEDELKVLSDLRADNQRLKDENAALIRVISKLSK